MAKYCQYIVYMVRICSNIVQHCPSISLKSQLPPWITAGSPTRKIFLCSTPKQRLNAALPKLAEASRDLIGYHWNPFQLSDLIFREVSAVNGKKKDEKQAQQSRRVDLLTGTALGEGSMGKVTNHFGRYEFGQYSNCLQANWLTQTRQSSQSAALPWNIFQKRWRIMMDVEGCEYVMMNSMNSILSISIVLHDRLTQGPTFHGWIH